MTIADPDALTRRNVHHALLRAVNERVLVGGPAYEEAPAGIFMNQFTLEELELDADPDYASVMDFEGKTFTSIPITVDPRLGNGVFTLSWHSQLPGESSPGTHPFEVFDGASGMVCTAMVLRDGDGESCGLPADDPIHVP